MGVLRIYGKIISELAKAKDIVWQGRKIKADELTYKEKGKKITVILDTLFTSEAVKTAENSDLLIAEATYTSREENLAKEYKHLTAKQAGEIAKKAKAKKLILTHISQRYEASSNLILNEAKKIFSDTSIAEDFDILEI